jgi:hypothetical protein
LGASLIPLSKRLSVVTLGPSSELEKTPFLWSFFSIFVFSPLLYIFVFSPEEEHLSERFVHPVLLPHAPLHKKHQNQTLAPPPPPPPPPLLAANACFSRFLLTVSLP